MSYKGETIEDVYQRWSSSRREMMFPMPHWLDVNVFIGYVRLRANRDSNAPYGLESYQ